MIHLKNDKTWIGDVCAKVAGNCKTNRVTEYWVQRSRVRYANELINMQKHYNSSTKIVIHVRFSYKHHWIKLSYLYAQCGVKRSNWGHLWVRLTSNDPYMTFDPDFSQARGFANFQVAVFFK